MGQAALYVTLSVQQDQQLFELKDAANVPKRTRIRAEMLRLSHRGWKSNRSFPPVKNEPTSPL